MGVYRNDICQTSSYSKAKNSRLEPIEGFVTDTEINFQEKSCFGIVTYIKLERFTTQGSFHVHNAEFLLKKPIRLQFITFSITSRK